MCAAMVDERYMRLRAAIEHLFNVKLTDALSNPAGLQRLTAHRVTGVASHAIREAERRLDEVLAEVLAPPSGGGSRRPSGRENRRRPAA